MKDEARFASDGMNADFPRQRINYVCAVAASLALRMWPFSKLLTSMPDQSKQQALAQ
ncbi:hypothetical protein [Paraburkholderia jirisanensis]